jgi:hypothetical protein
MTDTPDPSMPSPLSCFLGAVVAAIIAIALYRLTNSIAISFAAKPIHSDNTIIVRLSIAIRTLVIGSCTMGTGIFGLASLGLMGLGIQLLFKKEPSDVQ